MITVGQLEFRVRVAAGPESRRCRRRPGQCGRADGYILEGKELEFYVKKMQKKKSKAAA